MHTALSGLVYLLVARDLQSSRTKSSNQACSTGVWLRQHQCSAAR